MALSEFALIDQYFAQQSLSNPMNKLGIGDDCAIAQIPAGHRLILTADTMVENTHFFSDADPEQLGHKLLAVNLSDLAAMGAEPFAVTLALTLPTINPDWLEAFSKGFLALAKQHQVDLIGGDTTKGPLSLTVQAMGVAPEKQALLRSGAKPGDYIFVTGDIGLSGLGLKIKQGLYDKDCEQALRQFNAPLPRIEEGVKLRGIANACIDISDGLAADLTHILTKSEVGATIAFDKLPLHVSVIDYIKQSQDWRFPLISGEDYQLCFTVPSNRCTEINFECTEIGRIEASPGLRVLYNGRIEQLEERGFEHFS